MGIEDLASSESAFVAAATATVLSPRVRETLRRGAVYGVAGALKVGDVVAGAARGAARGVRTEQVATGTGGPNRTRNSSPRPAMARASGPASPRVSSVAPARRSSGAPTRPAPASSGAPATKRAAASPRTRARPTPGGSA